MKVLVVDVNFDYKNPMYRQIYNSMSTEMEVEYFGPGYVNRNTLDKGVQAYIGNNSYNAIIVGIYFIYGAWEGLRYDTYSIHRNVIPYYKVNDAYQCSKRILDDLIKMNHSCKILFYYEDMGMMSDNEYKMCNSMMENNFYIWCFPTTKQKLSVKYKYMTNNAYRLIENNKRKVIPLTIHAISSNEIFIRNYWDREYEWCIPGNRNSIYYPERQKAFDVISKQNDKVWKEDPYQKLSVNSVLPNKLHWYKFRNNQEKMISFIVQKDKFISSYPKPEYIASCREVYMESMRNTKIVYAEGGIVDGLVRKYYEACACGALLVAKRTWDIEDMGFVDGKNCIIVDKYEELADLSKHLPELKKRADIAQEGQKLIINKHMFKNRVESLKMVILSINEGNYKGAYWCNGDFCLL